MAEHYIKGPTFDDVYMQILWQLNRYPDFVCSPRDQKIKENLAVTFELTNPRSRLLSCKERETNTGFAVGEFLWYWRGANDLESMLYYNKRMKDFSDDGKTLNSAYGYRLKETCIPYDMGRDSRSSQWLACIETLLKDADSRRAILLVNSVQDNIHAAYSGSKDVPCTLSMQFFVRNNKLHLHAHMRSNDVIWGLTYDLYSFTMLQECMLLELKKHNKFKNLQLGKYYHTAGSLHIYERHFALAESIINEYADHDHRGVSPQLPLLSLDELERLQIFERELREGKSDCEADFFGDTSEWMAQQLVLHRAKRDREKTQK